MGTERGMTPGEIALAKEVFGDAIDYSQVRIHKGKVPGIVESHFQPDNVPVPTSGRDIYVPDKIYSDDLSKGNKSNFIHLMAYVWQFQEGTATPDGVKKWLMDNRNDLDKASSVTADPSKDLKDYNVEQRARLIERLYNYREDAKHPPEKQPDDPDGSLFLKKFGQQIKDHPNDPLLKWMANTLGITKDAAGALHMDPQKWSRARESQRRFQEDEQREQRNTMKVLSHFIDDPAYLDSRHPHKAPPPAAKNAPKPA